MGKLSPVSLLIIPGDKSTKSGKMHPKNESPMIKRYFLFVNQIVVRIRMRLAIASSLELIG
jgi:hypothetical protein